MGRKILLQVLWPVQEEGLTLEVNREIAFGSRTSSRSAVWEASGSGRQERMKACDPSELL